MHKKNLVAVKLDQRMRSELDFVAHQSMCTKSLVIRRALAHFFKYFRETELPYLQKLNLEHRDDDLW